VTATPAEERSSRALTRLTWLLGTTLAAEAALFAILAPLLPHLKRELDLTTTQAGLLAAVFSAGFAVGAVAAGVLASRVGGKRTLLLGLVLLGVTSAMFAAVDDYTPMFLVRAAQGVAGSAVWAGSLTWVAAAAPPNRRPQALGVVVGLGIAGTLLGPILGALALETSIAAVFGGIAAATVAGALVMAREPGARVVSDGAPAQALLRRGRVVMGPMWLVLLPSAAMGVLIGLMPLRLDRLGVGSTAIAAVFTVAGVLEAGMSPVAGRAIARFGLEPVTSFAVVVAIALFLALALPAGGVAVTVLLCACAAAVGSFWVPGSVRLHALAERDIVTDGAAFSLFSIAFAGGVMLGASGSAAVADATSEAVPCLALAGLLALTLARRVHSRDARHM
jgi:predicted MFS family arabinose efflux permease